MIQTPSIGIGTENLRALARFFRKRPTERCGVTSVASPHGEMPGLLTQQTAGTTVAVLVVLSERWRHGVWRYNAE